MRLAIGDNLRDWKTLQHLHQAANVIRVRMSSDHQINALDAEVLKLGNYSSVRLSTINEHGFTIWCLNKGGISLAYINKIKLQ